MKRLFENMDGVVVFIGTLTTLFFLAKAIYYHSPHYMWGAVLAFIGTFLYAIFSEY